MYIIDNKEKHKHMKLNMKLKNFMNIHKKGSKMGKNIYKKLIIKNYEKELLA